MTSYNFLELPTELICHIINLGFPDSLRLWAVNKECQDCLSLSPYISFIIALRNKKKILDIFDWVFENCKLELIIKMYQFKITSIPENKIIYKIDFIHYFQILWKRDIQIIKWLWNEIPDFTIQPIYILNDSKCGKSLKFIYINKIPIWMKNTIEKKQHFYIDKIKGISYKFYSNKRYNRTYLHNIIISEGLAYNIINKTNNQICEWLICQFKNRSSKSFFEHILSKIFDVSCDYNNIKMAELCLYNNSEYNPYNSISKLHILDRCYMSKYAKAEILEWLYQIFNVQQTHITKLALNNIPPNDIDKLEWVMEKIDNKREFKLKLEKYIKYYNKNCLDIIEFLEKYNI